jgi:hypothetical protein
MVAVYFQVPLGKTRQQGKTRQEKARQGKKCQGNTRQGKARQEKARQGKTSQGMTRQVRQDKTKRPVPNQAQIYEICPHEHRASSTPHLPSWLGERWSWGWDYDAKGKRSG